MALYTRRTTDQTNTLIGNASFYEFIGLILCFMGLFAVFGFKSQSTNIDPEAPVGKLYYMLDL